MVTLYRREDDAAVGAVSEQDLQFLIDCLVEEDSEDTDYYINRDTLDFLKGKSASAELMATLEGSLDGREEAELYYRPEEAGGAGPDQ